MDHCLIFTPICTALKPPYMILVYMVRTLMNKSVLHVGGGRLCGVKEEFKAGCPHRL